MLRQIRQIRQDGLGTRRLSHKNPDPIPNHAQKGLCSGDRQNSPLVKLLIRFSTQLHLLEIAESITTSGPMEEAYIPECPSLFQQHISHTNHHLGLNFSYLFFSLKT